MFSQSSLVAEKSCGVCVCVNEEMNQALLNLNHAE